MTPAVGSVPVLLVPTGNGRLVLPSGMVCEVVQNIEILPTPGTKDWVLGYCIWRNVPVPMISFERLLGTKEADIEMKRMVIMYPLPGREEYDYFGIATNGQPRSGKVGADVKITKVLTDMPQRYVSAAVELPDGLGIIPDFQALKATFYSN